MFQPGTGQPALLPGQVARINQYQVQVERYLSQGGYALVYIVTTQEPINNCTRHVLKRIIAPDQAGLTDVQNEVQRRLQGHPNIVNLIDSSWQRLPDYTYEILILMELCPGGGIIDMMNRRLRERLTEAEILQVFVDVCEAVAFMHSRKPPILHRDLKVENILQSTLNSYKLCDFGSASGPTAAPHTQPEIRSLENDLNKHTTLQYRAPEMVDLFLRRRIDEKSDIWALGVLLYKLCYYTTPFEGHGPIAILTVQYKIPAYPVYSQGLVKLIASMLREHGVQRPTIFSLLQSVHDLRGTKPRTDYPREGAASLMTFAPSAQIRRGTHDSLITPEQHSVHDLLNLSKTPATPPTRVPPVDAHNSSHPLSSTLGSTILNQITTRTGQHLKQSTRPSEIQFTPSFPASSPNNQAPTHLTDSFGTTFGAIRPTSGARLTVPNSLTTAPTSTPAPLNPSLLKGGKTGGSQHDAFKGLAGLSIRSLSITGPGRSTPIASSSNVVASSLKTPTPYTPPYGPDSTISLASSSPLSLTDGLSAELRYPPLHDIGGLAFQQSSRLNEVSIQSRLKPSAKLPSAEPRIVQPPHFLNSRSQQVTGSAMKISMPPVSQSTMHSHRLPSPTQDPTRVPILQPSISPRSRETAMSNEVTSTATKTGPFIEGGQAVISRLWDIPRIPRSISPRTFGTDSSEKAPNTRGTSSRWTERPASTAKTDSSSDEDGPENPVQRYHSNIKIDASNERPKRGRKSSVHNLVDFYEAGTTIATANNGFGARLRRDTSPEETFVDTLQDNRENKPTNPSNLPFPKKVKMKRPQSALVTSTSFGGASDSGSPRKGGSIESSSNPMNESTSAVANSPAHRRSPEEPALTEFSPSRETDCRRKPPTARSLVALLEADNSGKQNKPPISRGEPSPERSFRGVGDLIQRWQTLSQNK